MGEGYAGVTLMFLRLSDVRRVFAGLLIAVSGGGVAVATEIITDFEEGFGLWQTSPTGTWEIQTVDGNRIAALTAAGVQPGGVRRPTGYLLLSGIEWTDTTLEMRAQTSEPSTKLPRDVVMIFGYVDATHFYYAHLSSNSDDRFHTIIMKVAGAERQVIDEQRAPPAPLTDAWHDIRITHAASGAIRVYVDDMKIPVLTAQDTTYPSGAVGVGSFDDRARFDDIRVTGTARFER
jgi:hypothetical protein